MKQTRAIMGMPITIEVADSSATDEIFNTVFGYMSYIDETFSPYKHDSELMQINRGELAESEWSDDMKTIFALAEEAKQKTHGYFDIQKPDGSFDPSGITNSFFPRFTVTVWPLANLVCWTLWSAVSQRCESISL